MKIKIIYKKKINIGDVGFRNTSEFKKGFFFSFEFSTPRGKKEEKE